MPSLDSLTNKFANRNLAVVLAGAAVLILLLRIRREQKRNRQMMNGIQVMTTRALRQQSGNSGGTIRLDEALNPPQEMTWTLAEKYSAEKRDDEEADESGADTDESDSTEAEHLQPKPAEGN